MKIEIYSNVINSHLYDKKSNSIKITVLTEKISRILSDKYWLSFCIVASQQIFFLLFEFFLYKFPISFGLKKAAFLLAFKMKNQCLTGKWILLGELGELLPSLDEQLPQACVGLQAPVRPLSIFKITSSSSAFFAMFQ